MNGTCLGNANDVTVLKTDGNSLSLDRRGFFVANTFNTFEDGLRDIRLCPRP